MFYKTLILILFLISMAFGAGMAFDTSKIRRLTAFKLIVFWSVIISAQAGGIAAITLNGVFKKTQLKNAASLITLILGAFIILISKSKKAGAPKGTTALSYIFPVLYICINTFLLTTCFALCGIKNQNTILAVAVLETLFLCYGIYIRERLSPENIKTSNLYCLSGALIILMSLIYYI